MDDQRVGRAIRAIRAVKRLRQTDVAAQAKVSPTLVGRGVIDVLAWNAGASALVVIELKTELVEINELMGVLDRKRRLARDIGIGRGWTARSVSTWVIVADSRTNRRALATHEAVLRAKFPADGRTMRRWLRDPSERVDALSFLPSIHEVKLGRDLRPIRRVTRPRKAGSRASGSRRRAC